MEKILLALGILFGCAAQAEVRSVFKFDHASTLSVHGAPLRHMTFGLSRAQVERIRALSDIDMGNVYYVDHALDEQASFASLSAYKGTIHPNVPPPGSAQQEPKFGDPELANEWWIEKLRVHEAWKMATGAGVTIADCDAGYHHDEPDLLPNMLLDYRYDLSDRDAPLVVNDGNFAYHGTAVAAIMVGVLNGAGTNGIAYNSKLVPLQNYNYDQKDDLDKEEATAKCILHAINTPDVDIIVLENQTSNGSSETFIGTRDAVRLAQQAGIVVVGAGGNYSTELIEERNDDTGSIIVGALAQDGSAAGFTNYGKRLTVGAFGEKLHTLYGPNGMFGSFGGTSGATPQVAATVALMKEVNPMLTPALARSILEETRVITPGNERAGGRLVVPAAVEKAREAVVDLRVWTEQWLFRRRLMAILSMP